MATPIRGTSSLTADAALRAIRSASPGDVRPADTALFVHSIVALGEAFKLKSSVLLAQAWHETGAFGPSGRWRELNPAGLGITAAGDATPYFLIDGDEAAAIHVWTMLVALRLFDRAAEIALPAAANGWKDRWTAKYQDPACPEVRDVEDLNLIYSGNRATWATDPGYATKIIAVLDRLFPNGEPHAAEPEEDAPLVFGRVPHPEYHDRPIAKAEGAGQNNLGKRSVKGVVWHRMLGSLNGTDGFFRRGDVNALTDYGVGVESIDGSAFDGVIYRWNDPYGYQSGWASGPVLAPWGDGVSFVRKYGINGVNRDQVSIEISGQYATPLTESCRKSVIDLTAYFADQYGIPWNEFPISRQDGFSFVRWHQEFTGPQEKVCPGAEVIRETDALMERVKQQLKRHQTGGSDKLTPAAPEFAAPITYSWLARETAAEGLDRAIDDTPVYYFPSVYLTIEETPRNQHAGPDAPPIGPPIEKGTQFRADYVFRSRGISWILTPYGTRVRASALLPKIQITTGGTISVRREEDGRPEVVRHADV